MKKIRFILSLLILGTFLLLPVWYTWIAPLIKRLPNDFTYQVDLVSKDNLYSIEKGDFLGESISQTDFSLNTISANPGVLEMQGNFTVTAADGTSIVDIERTYAVNPVTLEHVEGFGDQDRTGYIFAPRYTSKKDTFTYWHINYNAPIEMKFVEATSLHGLSVYRFQAQFTSDQTKELNHLPNVGETLGVTVDTTLDIWIEPISGWLVNYQDASQAYYYDLVSKERIQPWNTFSNTLTDASVIENVERAQSERGITVVVDWVIPLVLVVLLCIYCVPIVMKNNNFINQLVRRALPYMVIGIGITLSLGTFFTITAFRDRQDYIDAQMQATHVTEAIHYRLQQYEDVLLSARALWYASETITREEWGAFINHLNVDDRYPGIQAISYSTYITPENKAAFEASLQQGEFVDRTIYPSGDRSAYVVVTYSEPQNDFNKAAIGYDMYSQTGRQEALDKARDTGSCVATNKITLVNDNARQAAAFIVYLPVYSTPNAFTVADRRSSIQGYISAPFIMEDFIEGIFADDKPTTEFVIYDASTGQNEEGVLFESNFFEGAELQGAPVVTRQIHVLDKLWVVAFYDESYNSSPAARLEVVLSIVIAVLGIIASVLLGGIIYAAERGYLRVSHRAKKKTSIK